MTKIDHEPVTPVTDPETNEKIYPWTTLDGYPVEANGAVTDCGCPLCPH